MNRKQRRSRGERGGIVAGFLQTCPRCQGDPEDAVQEVVLYMLEAGIERLTCKACGNRWVMGGAF